MIPLKDMRSNIYFDWSIRDLVIRAVIHLYNNGYPKQVLDEFIEYLIRKIREDYNHVTAVMQVARMFEKRGCTAILTESRNKLVDLVVMTPTRLFFIEVKPHPPPWGGMNPREKNDYELLPYPVYYVWRDNNGYWYYTVTDNLEVRDGKVYVKAKYPLQRLLEMAR